MIKRRSDKSFGSKKMSKKDARMLDQAYRPTQSLVNYFDQFPDDGKLVPDANVAPFLAVDEEPKET